MAELRQLVDRAEAYVNGKGWGWELEPIRRLIDGVEVKGRERIGKALRRFDELRPVRTGKTTVWLEWRGEGVLSVHWPEDRRRSPTMRLKLGGLSATAVLGRGVLGPEERRLYWLGWRASGATKTEKYPAMGTADLAQVLAWASAVPGRVRVYTERIGLTLDGPHIQWWAEALDHVERVKDKSAILGEAFSSPLSALGHVLGDGSPHVKKDGERVLRVVASGKALDVIARALKEAMEGLGIGGRVYVDGKYAVVKGLAARRLAGWMIDNTPSPLHELLDVTRFGKWERLKAVAEPIHYTEAPAIVVDGYRWGLHLHGNGLRAETRVAGAAEAVRGLGLSPRVRGRDRRIYLSNTDTRRLVGWAAQRDPGLLDRVEEYLRRWLGTGKARAAERELRKLARIRERQ